MWVSAFVFLIGNGRQLPSFRRKPKSSGFRVDFWIPACAGMTRYAECTWLAFPIQASSIHICAAAPHRIAN